MNRNFMLDLISAPLACITVQRTPTHFNAFFVHASEFFKLKSL